MSETLKASMSHWKVSRPKGLEYDTCWKVINGMGAGFSN